jgi:hypothetical protein
MRNFLSSLLILLSLSACSFEPAVSEDADSAEFATGTLRQGVISGCGVDVYNRWADDLLGGMATNVWLANFGSSACTYKVQVEMKEGTTSYFSEVYPSHTLQPTNPAVWPPSPNRKIISLFPDVQSPCQMRVWLKMNNQWTFESWTTCF